MEDAHVIPLNLPTAQGSLEQFKQLIEIMPLDQEDESFTPLSIYRAENSIQAFKKLPLTKTHRKSFIEIMGLSHLENVSSKTLAFFMDSKEEHNLNDLVINALFSALGESFPYQIHTENIVLEKRTELGRIDLWVETDEHILVIENKIHHHANDNPFNDYVSHARANNPKDKKLKFILLVIKEPELTPESYIVMTHFDLSKHILKELGQKSLQADQYYLTYLIDYISAIEKFNPHSEYSKMQMDIVNFYRNNREVLESIQDEKNKESVYQYYEQKVREIVELLKDQELYCFSDVAEFVKYEGDLSSIGGSLNSQTLHTTQDDYQLEFEIYKSTSNTALWCRRFKTKNMKKLDSLELQAFLTNENIPFIEQDNHYDVLLLDESESISAEEFVEKATPIIQQILSKSDVTND
ncbi:MULTISPECIES: PD-(D/E)XK nuclease family protein [Acinetobacter]|uniref:PD-(D/E)XK nuclease family protein n=1 Tax=Acinetobacter TaxID=469 RepID=UPI000447617B|nr:MULTISPECIES: PD-(D/E)XK nuclease family protein [Acinetobacter]EXE12114.1 PD-(D/E)XK nuclease superfamily protein [Acinetobacter sp. 983759]MCM1934663.1 PD-(D/E)XK nuclease family protein [Acinetobacter radioresistens]MCM1952050.1 PD-(D/E)XK nuclease family protein [Acinetobacter radioresistens]MCU4309853.1 PD-(D/E)XK nuclease family protein [Acinetobacter radioresistens]MCU4568229.1 PD-(D/E)XK nuclease family protein [Acinetobacter radioresistens]